MTALCNTGRRRLIRGVRDLPYLVGLGRGAGDWDQSFTETVQFSNADLAQLAHRRPSSVVVKTPDEATTYVADTDYQVAYDVGRLVRLEAGAIPAGAAVKASYTSDRPAADVGVTGLVDAIGYRGASEVAYVVPDAAGDVGAGGGTFIRSPSPTRWLMVACDLALADAMGETVREWGVFAEPTFKAGGSVAAAWYGPTLFTNTGACIMYATAAGDTRDGSKGGRISFVISL